MAFAHGEKVEEVRVPRNQWSGLVQESWVARGVLMELDVRSHQDLRPGRIPNEVTTLRFGHSEEDTVSCFRGQFTHFVLVMSYLQVLHEAPKGMDMFKILLFVGPVVLVSIVPLHTCNWFDITTCIRYNNIYSNKPTFVIREFDSC